jgi:hypothetical protein
MKKLSRLGWMITLMLLTLKTFRAQEVGPKIISSAFLTFSPNHLIKEKENNFYLHGQLNVFSGQRISFAGDVFYDLGSTHSNPTFSSQHQLLFGLNYHWRKSINDIYTGIQPGFGVYSMNDLTQKGNQIIPILAFNGGYRIYISSHFHFFLEGHFVTGQSISKNIHSVSSLRFSAGLGLQL